MTALEKINKRCDELLELEDDWDGCGAPPVNGELVELVRKVLPQLPHPDKCEIVVTGGTDLEVWWRFQDLCGLEITFERPDRIYWIQWNRNDLGNRVTRDDFNLRDWRLEDLASLIRWVYGDRILSKLEIDAALARYRQREKEGELVSDNDYRNPTSAVADLMVLAEAYVQSLDKLSTNNYGGV